jgi:signal transduction histidine kinase
VNDGLAPAWISAAAWLLAGLACLSPLATAEETPPNWGLTLAERFSKTLEQNRLQRDALASRLADLPAIQVSNFGGPAGHISSRFSTPFSSKFESNHIELRWKHEQAIDFVCLVPARSFDEFGLDPQFGLPEDFDVFLIGEAGEIVATLARERDTSLDPVRNGKPFCYRLDPPVKCSGLRISASRSHRHSKRPGNWQFMAWGEIMCFDGEYNVALGAGVEVKSRSETPWPWWPTFAVDGVTGLGLPEVPDAPLTGIGWLSGPKASRDAPVWVQVDLGADVPTTGACFHPPQRPTGELYPGFAHPERFVIEVASGRDPENYRVVFDQSESDHLNPGHHPMSVTWPETSARFIRLRSVRLNKIAAVYPAFFGFSEFEVISYGKNAARGRPVTVSERNEPVRAHGDLFWKPESLTDGHTSRGRIVSHRRWMEMLDERHRIESGIHELDLANDAIAARYQRGAVSAAGVVGVLMLAGLIVLPIRYKWREKHQLRRLRARIASDLHDEIGSSLGSIQLLTESARRKPETTAERLNLISLLSASSVASLRDIVWLLRPGSAFQSPALSHFRETAAILIDTIDWDIECDDASRACLLARETNRDLLLFFREALHNAIRHSGCGSIHIRTTLENRVFTLEISDNGCGMPADLLSSPSCLRALKERAARLLGECLIRSAPGKGTTVTLTFPVNRSNSASKP